MTEKILENFSIAQICESGQCFRMEKIQDGRYQVIAGDRYLELEQQGNRVRFDCTEVEYRDFWRHYFDIETDYGAVMAQINPNDTYLTAAAQLDWGELIFIQFFWFCILRSLFPSKIISSEFAAVLRISVRPMERQRQRRMVSVIMLFRQPRHLPGLKKML